MKPRIKMLELIRKKLNIKYSPAALDKLRIRHPEIVDGKNKAGHWLFYETKTLLLIKRIKGMR